MAIDQYALVIGDKYHYFSLFPAKAQVFTKYLEYFRRFGVLSKCEMLRLEEVFYSLDVIA